MKQVIAYCDGGSRGNPGPSACAFAVYEGDVILHKEARYLGTDKTNNYAEYQGLIKLQEFLLAHALPRVLIFCDSQLIVNQTNGNWKINEENLKPLCAYAQGLKVRIQSTLQYCKGHDGIVGNELCDQLVNECLDTYEKELANEHKNS